MITPLHSQGNSRHKKHKRHKTDTQKNLVDDVPARNNGVIIQFLQYSQRVAKPLPLSMSTDSSSNHGAMA